MHDMMNKGKVLESNAWSVSQTLKKEAEEMFFAENGVERAVYNLCWEWILAE